MIRIWKSSIVTSSYDPYTCGVMENPQFECLDIASSTVSTGLFGGLCTGTNSDGYVGAYDVAKLLSVQFELMNENTLPQLYSTIPTVYPRIGTSTRCSYNGPLPVAGGVGYDDPTNYFNGVVDWNIAVNSAPCVNAYEYVSRLAMPPPPPNGRRMLIEGPTKRHMYNRIQVTVQNWMKTHQGEWLRYSITGVQVVMEIFIGGIRNDPLREVRLSNAPIPPYRACSELQRDVEELCEPTNPHTMQVRFARRIEYSYHGYDHGGCATILPVFGSTIAMLSNTLSIRQSPPENACEFDIFIWIPTEEYIETAGAQELDDWMATRPRACLLRGSTVAQLSGDGLFLDTDTCVSPSGATASSRRPNTKIKYARAHESNLALVVFFFVPVTVLMFSRLAFWAKTR